MTPAQLRTLVHAAIARAVNHGQRVEDATQEVLDLVARGPIEDFDAAGDALVELVADAITYGLGAWAEAVASTLDGQGEPAEATDVARTFLHSYRALLVLWSELPLDVKVSDALQSARLDAQASGSGYLLVDRLGRLRRLDPEHVTVDPTRRA